MRGNLLPGSTQSEPPRGQAAWSSRPSFREGVSHPDSHESHLAFDVDVHLEAFTTGFAATMCGDDPRLDPLLDRDTARCAPTEWIAASAGRAGCARLAVKEPLPANHGVIEAHSRFVASARASLCVRLHHSFARYTLSTTCECRYKWQPGERVELEAGTLPPLAAETAHNSNAFQASVPKEVGSMGAPGNRFGMQAVDAGHSKEPMCFSNVHRTLDAAAL